MGEHELWLNAQDIAALRLKCNHCDSEATFSGTDMSGPPDEIRCPNCNSLMAGAPELVVVYRQFVSEVRRQKRGARFLAKISQGPNQT